MPTSAASRQPRVVIAVAGVAGSGKTTLGRAIAASTGLPLLDLDSLTNPLLEALPTDAWGGHWMSSQHAELIRAGRYAALRAVAHDVVATGPGCVLVAPFTAELQGGEEWQALRQSVGRELKVVHLVGDAELFARRRSSRAEVRDDHRRAVVGPTSAPAVPVVSIDASLTTDQQLRQVIKSLTLTP